MMTVSELIEELSHFPSDMKILLKYYNDLYDFDRIFEQRAKVVDNFNGEWKESGDGEAVVVIE